MSDRSIKLDTHLSAMSAEAAAAIKKCAATVCQTCSFGYFPEYELVRFYPIGGREWDEEGWYHAGDRRCPAASMFGKPDTSKLVRVTHYQRSIWA